MLLEQKINDFNQKIDGAIESAKNVVSALKKLKSANTEGELKRINEFFKKLGTSAESLKEKTDPLNYHDFDISAYLLEDSTGESFFKKELFEEAQKKGLKIQYQDGRIYCYPVILKTLPSETSIAIDKKKTTKLRPSSLVNSLLVIQKNPPKFKFDRFLKSLYSCYKDCPKEPAILKSDIYERLTRLPGAKKEYSLQEFTRDLYLLDESNNVKTEDCELSFISKSTGVSPEKILSIITHDEKRKEYFAIKFNKIYAK